MYYHLYVGTRELARVARVVSESTVTTLPKIVTHEQQGR